MGVRGPLCDSKFATRLRPLYHGAASSHRFALGALRVCRRPAYPAIDLSAHGSKRALKSGDGGARRRRVLTYRVGAILRLDPLSVKEEAHTRDVLALPVAECIHKFPELSAPLDLEENLIVVVGDLDIEVLRLATLFWLLLRRRAVIGHVDRRYESTRFLR